MRIGACDLFDFDNSRVLMKDLAAKGVAVDILFDAVSITREAPLKSMKSGQWQAVRA